MKETEMSLLYKAICSLILLVIVQSQAFSKTREKSNQDSRIYSQITPITNHTKEIFLYDLTDQKVLIESNSDQVIKPASLTKLMTLEIIFSLLENNKISLSTRVPFSINAASKPNTKLGVPAGSSISLDEAINALSVHSCNDVATAIAELLGGSEDEFAKIMTQRAHQIGMRSTTFGNASGLPNVSNNTTARDLALLGASIILQHPDYMPFMAVKHWIWNEKDYANTNELMKTYPGLDFSKTGYIKASGFNLIVSMKHEDKNQIKHRFILVLIGAQTANIRDNWASQLLDEAVNKTK